MIEGYLDQLGQDIIERYYQYFRATENKEAAASLVVAELIWLCLGEDEEREEQK